MSRTIILIDDDPEDLDIMKQAIANIDANLLCVSFIYPEEALKVLLGKELRALPEWIFIDINMPTITGDKCLKAFRADKNFDRVIITLYSTSMPEAVSEALKTAGANFTFAKPVRLKAYEEILRNIIII